MKKIILSVLFLSVFFMFGCFGASKGVNSDILDKKEFILINFPGSEDIFIGFEEGRVYGFSGVNRYTGSYKINGDKIEFIGMGSTMMAGPEDKTALETKYLEALSNADSFTLNNDTLRLGSLEYKLK